MHSDIHRKILRGDGAAVTTLLLYLVGWNIDFPIEVNRDFIGKDQL